MSLGNNQKSQGERSGLRNCVDAHQGQIICNKDGIVDWCIVLVEMPLTSIRRLLASSDGISSWTPLKPQHSNPNPNPLTNQLWSIDFHTPPTPLIIPHRLSAFLESLMPLKNWCSIHVRYPKTVWSIPYVSVAFFPSLNRVLLHIVLPYVQIAFFKIHQLWQSGFSRVYSNSCCSCWFVP